MHVYLVYLVYLSLYFGVSCQVLARLDKINDVGFFLNASLLQLHHTYCKGKSELLIAQEEHQRLELKL